MKVISIAIGLLFLGLGIPMVSGKAENFIVGSASPDNELRNNFDTKKLCRIFGIYLIFVAIFTALLGFFFNRNSLPPISSAFLPVLLYASPPLD